MNRNAETLQSFIVAPTLMFHCHGSGLTVHRLTCQVIGHKIVQADHEQKLAIGEEIKLSEKGSYHTTLIPKAIGATNVWQVVAFYEGSLNP